MEEAASQYRMKQKLAAGELVLCMNLRLALSVDIAMVAKAGSYDAPHVDMEESPSSIETTSAILGRRASGHHGITRDSARVIRDWAIS